MMNTQDIVLTRLLLWHQNLHLDDSIFAGNSAGWRQTYYMGKQWQLVMYYIWEKSMSKTSKAIVRDYHNHNLDWIYSHSSMGILRQIQNINMLCWGSHMYEKSITIKNEGYMFLHIRWKGPKGWMISLQHNKPDYHKSWIMTTCITYNAYEPMHELSTRFFSGIIFQYINDQLWLTYMHLWIGPSDT